jgi:hypothetical protein
MERPTQQESYPIIPRGGSLPWPRAWLSMARMEALADAALVFLLLAITSTGW